MDLKNIILREVNEYHNKTDGKCGLTPIQLCDNINIEYSKIKHILNELHSNRLIKVRKGINHYLLFRI